MDASWAKLIEVSAKPNADKNEEFSVNDATEFKAYIAKWQKRKDAAKSETDKKILDTEKDNWRKYFYDWAKRYNNPKLTKEEKISLVTEKTNKFKALLEGKAIATEGSVKRKTPA
jgi:hypothetical protein